MDGHTDLIAMRLKGYVPSVGVHIAVTDGEWMPTAQCMPAHAGDIVGIRIRPDEQVNRLDLHCVIGLKVLVDGDRGTEQTVRAVCDRIALLGAKRVKGLVREINSARMDDQPENAWIFDFAKDQSCI